MANENYTTFLTTLACAPNTVEIAMDTKNPSYTPSCKASCILLTDSVDDGAIGKRGRAVEKTSAWNATVRLRY